eukprot:jgi/Psemu1/4259/gm1.4259_g
MAEQASQCDSFGDRLTLPLPIEISKSSAACDGDGTTRTKARPEGRACIDLALAALGSPSPLHTTAFSEQLVAFQERSRTFGEILRSEICDEPTRAKFVSTCTEHVPNGVDLIDGVVLVLVLARITKADVDPNNIFDSAHIDLGNFHRHNQEYCDGNQGIEDDYECGRKWTYATNSNGRITKLEIGTDFNNFDLPCPVGHLDRLEEICIFGDCRSLPANELSRLPHLVDLRFHQCWTLVEDFPATGFFLEHLKRLEIENTFASLGTHFLQWMTKQLHTGLTHLKFRCMEENGTESILGFLGSLEPNPGGSLETLCIEALDVDDAHLETVFFAIAPKFVNLTCLDLTGTAIGSVQPIAKRMANDACFRDYVRRLRPSDSDTDCGNTCRQETKMLDRLPSPPSEHAIGLYKNELRKGLDAVRDGGSLESYNPCFVPKSLRRLLLPSLLGKRDNPEEISALRSLFENATSIHDIDGAGVSVLDRSSMHLRQINYAGRRILKDDGGRSFPASLWPTVVKRSFDFSSDPDGPYYLLRHGPILIPS